MVEQVKMVFKIQRTEVAAEVQQQLDKMQLMELAQEMVVQEKQKR